MSNQVYANNMEVSCKQAAGKSICAFPDVCMTPPQTPATPPGVPIPYPNTGMASDTSDGSTSVKVSGQEVMLKNKSCFKKSMGDEAGAAPMKGVVTHKNTGKVFFNAWSMDVKFEGENVVRMLDLTTHNHGSVPGNSPPYIYTDEVAVALQQPPNQCDELSKTLDATMTEELPPSLTDGATVAVGFHMPAPGQANMVAGASSIGAAKITRGGKYQHYAKGIKRGDPSNAKKCGGNEAHKYKDQAQPYEGHAEAKMIEDFFKPISQGGLGGQGVLVLKISRPPCAECDRLIRSVNENSSGGPDCNNVYVCP
jgi:Domain of unknown function (DUF4150)